MNVSDPLTKTLSLAKHVQHREAMGVKLLSHPTYKSAQGRQTPCEFLNISDCSRQLHAFNSAYLSRICLDTSA